MSDLTLSKFENKEDLYSAMRKRIDELESENKKLKSLALEFCDFELQEELEDRINKLLAIK